MSTIASSYSATLAQILSNITLYVDLVIFVFGIIGCIGNLITYTSRQMRQSSAVLYLLCAAASQLVTILICVGIRVTYDHSGSNLINQSAVFCKFRYYLAITLPSLASYYMFLATLDRFFSTSENVRIRAWSQVKVAKRMAAAMLIVGVTMPIHILILFDIYNNACQISPGSIYTFIFASYLIIVVIFLPHILMFIFSLKTVMAFIKSRKRVIPAITGDAIPNRRRTLELKLIKIMVVQVSLSILLSLLRFGSASYRSIVFNIVTPTADQRAAESFAETLGSSLYFFNYALSFYASIVTSKFFRTAFYERTLFFYGRCVRQLMQRN